MYSESSVEWIEVFQSMGDHLSVLKVIKKKNQKHKEKKIETLMKQIWSTIISQQ